MNQTKDTMLIFDLDGTLWDSAKEVAESWNIILKNHIPELATLDADAIHAIMGLTMKEIAEISLPEMPEEQRNSIFYECQTYEIDYIREHGGTLFPGVRETLQKLKEKGYRMSVVSNCQLGYIEAFLTSMDMKEFFCDYEEWERTMKSKAENIRLVMDRNGFEKAVYIGDIERDMIAATDAGIPFIHAAYGFGEIPDAKTVIQEFRELEELF